MNKYDQDFYLGIYMLGLGMWSSVCPDIGGGYGVSVYQL